MAAEWYYTTNKQQMGPVSWPELRELAEVGILKPHDMVWTDGMDEWVKAINQNGLFAEEDDQAAVTARPKKKSAYVEAKPPPGRRNRKRVEEEEDDEDEEHDRRQKNRQREEDSAKRGIGVRIFLGIAAVLVVLMMLLCGGGTLVWLAWPNKNAVQPKPGPIAGPAPGFQAGAPQPLNYTVVNLQPGRDDVRNFNFQQGKRIIITVNNTLQLPNTDVDLFVHPANNLNQLVVADMNVPAVNRNCRVEFVAPATQAYTVRINNLGPGVATRCQVNIEER